MSNFYLVSKIEGSDDSIVLFNAQGEGVDNEAAANEAKATAVATRPWQVHEVIDQDAYDRSYGDDADKPAPAIPADDANANNGADNGTDNLGTD